MFGRRGRRGPHDGGSASVELVILAPGLLMFLLLAIYAGRVAMARQSVHAAAADAARSASLARTEAVASGRATSAAEATLAAEGLRCAATRVELDTSAFRTTVGTAAMVSATVRCTVDLTDLVVPGVPGRRELTATVTSPLDTYRER
jgi:Flp pilus assembly protein TadG